MTKKKLFEISARITFSGAYMEVEAETEAEARAIAEADPDYAMTGAEMVEWKITQIRETEN